MSFPVKMLAAAAGQQRLDFLIIGGHAVNSYAPPRATLDVDLLVRKADRTAWCELAAKEGYRLLHDGGAFLQFSPPYGVDFRLDLMLVNETTFDQLAESAREVACLGIQARIPSPLNLIALKVHALRHGPATRQAKDWLDIDSLIRTACLNPRGPELKAVFDRHGSAALYTELVARFRDTPPA